MSALARLPERGGRAYQELVTRRPIGDEVRAAAASIIGEVRRGGDHALIEMTERFDGVRIPARTMCCRPVGPPAASAR